MAPEPGSAGGQGEQGPVQPGLAPGGAPPPVGGERQRDVDDEERHRGERGARAALGAVVLAIAFALLVQPAGVVTAGRWMATLPAVAVAWLSGENIRSRRAEVVDLRERAGRLEAEREERDRLAV